MKIMIIGHKNHGKDFLAEYISKKLNLKFLSATDFFFKNVLIDKVEGFKTIDDCLKLKESTLGRDYLYNLFNNYNNSDGSGFKSIKDVLKNSDIYCGCRDINSYLSAKKEGFDSTIEETISEISNDLGTLIKDLADSYSILDEATVSLLTSFELEIVKFKWLISSN